MKGLLRRNTFWMALIMGIIALYPKWYAYVHVTTWNLNRTIGWGRESFIDMEEVNFVKYVNLMEIISHYSIPLFAIGYTVLYLDKRNTKTLFLILHLFAIGLIMMTPSYFIDFFLLFMILSWGMFLLSVFTSRKIENTETIILKKI